MRIAIEMPRAGFDEETARLAGWLKRVGDRVERGEAIAEVETEKATVELEALDSGRLVEIVHEAGAQVGVGETIGWLEGDA
jgi:pyruvate dehydrogenase E2 component (dihydrolipoamide acetyltransferase)